MRFKYTAGLFAATALAMGALNLGCDSGKTSEKPEGSKASSAEGGRPENAPVTGTGGSTTSAGAGVGTGGGTGAGAGRTGFDGAVNATSEPAATAGNKSEGTATEPSKHAEPSSGTAKSGSEKSGESK